MRLIIIAVIMVMFGGCADVCRFVAYNDGHQYNETDCERMVRQIAETVATP